MKIVLDRHEMESHPLSRHLEVHGLKLPDHNPVLSVEEIRSLYATQYPEINTATVTRPEQVGNKLVYRFSTAVEIQGAFAFFFRLGFQALCL